MKLKFAELGCLFEALFLSLYRHSAAPTRSKLQRREKAKDDFHGGHGYVELEDDGRSRGNLSYVGSSSIKLEWRVEINGL